MSYTNETTHFAIPLPLGSDLTTPMDYNEAAEAIDTALFEAQGDAATANENAAAAVETANATSEALGTLSTTVGGHTSQIAALAARMTGAENDITDVRSDLEDMVTAYNEPTATSTHAYAAGDYFIYNDVLYKATTSISIGETIVPNTNCEATNITTEISAIKSDLSDLVPAVIASIPKDGVRTYTQALDNLYALLAGLSLENTQISGLKLKFGNANLHVDSITDSAIYFSGLTCGGGVVFSGVKLAASGSEFVTNTLSSGGVYSHVDNSSATAEGLYLIR